MTLIIGVKCQDGIVIGADSLTTFGYRNRAGGQATRSEYLVCMTAVIAICGSSGSQPIDQRGTTQMHGTIVREEEHKMPTVLSLKFQKIMWSQISDPPWSMQRTRAHELLGARSVFDSVRCQFARGIFLLDNSHVLLFYDESAQSHRDYIRVNLLVSIGSGSLSGRSVPSVHQTNTLEQ